MSKLLQERWSKLAGLPPINEEKERLNEGMMDILNAANELISNWDVLGPIWDTISSLNPSDALEALKDALGTDVSMAFGPIVGGTGWARIKDMIAGRAQDDSMNTSKFTQEELKAAPKGITPQDAEDVRDHAASTDGTVYPVMRGSVQGGGGASAQGAVQQHLSAMIKNKTGLQLTIKTAAISSGAPDIEIDKTGYGKLLKWAQKNDQALYAEMNKPVFTRKGVAFEVKNAAGGSLDVSGTNENTSEADADKKAIQKLGTSSNHPPDLYYIVGDGPVAIYKLQTGVGSKMDDLFWGQNIGGTGVKDFVEKDGYKTKTGWWLSKDDQGNYKTQKEPNDRAGWVYNTGPMTSLGNTWTKNVALETDPAVNAENVFRKAVSGTVKSGAPNAMNNSMTKIAQALKAGKVKNTNLNLKVPDNFPRGFKGKDWGKCTRDQVINVFALATPFGDSAGSNYATQSDKKGRLVLSSWKKMSDAVNEPDKHDVLIDTLNAWPGALLNAIEILIYRHNESAEATGDPKITDRNQMKEIKALATAAGLNPDWYEELPAEIFEVVPYIPEMSAGDRSQDVSDPTTSQDGLGDSFMREPTSNEDTEDFFPSGGADYTNPGSIQSSRKRKYSIAARLLGE